MSTRFPRAMSLALMTGAVAGGLPSTAAKAESSWEPPAQYAALPSGDQVSVPAVTGSLPDAGRRDVPGSSGFYASVGKGGILVRASAPTECLPGDLRELVAQVATKFGPISVESTHRSRGRNWRAGGARRSLHLSCRAIDFRVKARAREAIAYLRSRPEVGGLKVYRNGIIHIDNGERRSW